MLFRSCSQTDCADGANPYAGVIMDSAGHLFGTTFNGGGGTGAVYELSGGTVSVLHKFCSQNCADGAYPSGAVILDPSGNLLGTTFAGGKYNSSGGTVFRLTS